MPNYLTDPLTRAPRRIADIGANLIDNPQGEGSWGRGLVAGSLQGIGDIATDMTSPLGLGTALVGMPELRSLLRLKNVANVAKGTSKVDEILKGIVEEARIGGNRRLPSIAKERIRKRESLGYEVPDNPNARALEAERLAIERMGR